MVYSDTQIFEAISRGHIICFPFDPENVKGSSVDVRLGRYMYSTDHITGAVSYNPRDPDEVKRYFKLFEAETHAQLCEKLRLPLFKHIPEDQLMFILRPGERVLAHTHEYIGILPPGTTEMRARSSTGRNGITVCKCAGWGDPGYATRWTMEIECTNQEYTPVLVGERVAQIIFHHTGPVQNHYAETGKYQTGWSLVETVRHWQPEHMLPKSYKDPVAAPPEPTTEEALVVMADIDAYNEKRKANDLQGTVMMDLQDGSFLRMDEGQRDCEYGPGWRQIYAKYVQDTMHSWGPSALAKH